MDRNSEDKLKNYDFFRLDDEVARVLAILEKIAATFPPESEQSLAIRDAAWAFSTVQRHKGMKASYDKMRIASGGELTEEMKAQIRSHWIDPDDFEYDDEDE